MQISKLNVVRDHIRNNRQTRNSVRVQTNRVVDMNILDIPQTVSEKYTISFKREITCRAIWS